MSMDRERRCAMRRRADKGLVAACRRQLAGCRGGFTLVEILAVVALMGLASVTLLGSLRQTSGAHERRDAVRALVMLDREGRQMAREWGAMVVECGSDEIRLRRRETGNVIRMEVIRAPVNLFVGGEYVTQYTIDAKGHSPCVVVSVSGDERGAALEINGRSGWPREVTGASRMAGGSS